MKVILLVLFVFESTNKSFGLKQNVLEHHSYPSNTVFLDGVGVGSSANEQNSHILFANTEERITPITTDTTLQTLTKMTRPTTKINSMATSAVTTFLKEITTRLTTTFSSQKTALNVATTEGATLPSTAKTTLTTTGKITLPTTRKLILPTTGKITLPTTGKITMQTTEETTVTTNEITSLPTTEDTTVTTNEITSLPTTEDTTVTTNEITSLQTTEVTTFPTTESTAVPTTPVVNTTPLSVVFKDCGSSGSHINSGQINSVKFQCSAFNFRRFCSLKRNTTARIFVNFTSNVDATKVRTIVHGFLSGYSPLISSDGEEGIRYTGITEDACVNNVDHCNIKAGEVIQYRNAAFIHPLFPLTRLTIKLEIRDDQDRNLACIRFPAEIVN